jgi:[acyl-carrier-protein] S-malonyltransferase
MAPTVAVFPNEGSHYIGMGREFYSRSLLVRKYYDDLEKELKIKLAKVCFLGPKEEQDKILYSHLSVFISDLSFYEVLIQNKRKPEILTGVGIGELVALVAAESIPFLPTIHWLFQRVGIFETWREKYSGTSLYISGIKLPQLESIIEKNKDSIYITQYLSSENFMVWGSTEAITMLQNAIQTIKLIKFAYSLNRGPIFTSHAKEMIQDLNQSFSSVFGDEKIKMPKLRIFSTYLQKFIETVEDIKLILFQQYTAPVDWIKTCQTLTTMGYRTWIEIGPGKVYSTLLKKIDINTRIVNVEDVKSLSTTLKILNS